MSLQMRPTLMAFALAAAFPAMAQSNEELLKELQALKAKVSELEKRIQTPSGMTPEQSAEFNRIAAKTEAMQDNLTDKGFAGMKLSGYLEPVFVWNQRQNRAGFQFLNQQADGYFYDTSFMGSAVLDITKETESGTVWKLTLAPNRGVGAAMDGMSIVQEASVSVPLTDLQTRFIAGQIPDWSGYEYQQPTLNPFTTHNLLYDFTLPIAYTGVGLDVKQGKWWLRTAVANVNTAVRQAGEKSPALALRIDYAKGEFSGWGAAALVGKAPNFGTGTNTQAFLAEADAWFTRGDVTLSGQVSYGRQKQGATLTDAAGERMDSEWWGFSGLAGYNVTPRYQLLVRADYIRNTKNGGGLFTYNDFDGRNGIGPGQGATDSADRGANRYALSLGMKYLLNTSTTLKAEYRLDGADRAVFEDVKSGTYKKTNSLVATSMVVAF